VLPHPCVDQSLFERQDRFPLKPLQLGRVDPEVFGLGFEEARLFGGNDDHVEQILPVVTQHIPHALIKENGNTKKS
jgi:hypothetical protein